MTKEKQPKLIKQFDKRSGHTYFYESISYWDSEKKQSRAKRKLVGKLDPTTGEMVPTDGRMKKKKIVTSPVPPLTAIKRSFYGATYALSQVAKTIGLTEDLKVIFPTDYQSFLALAYYLVLAPTSSMQKFNRWSELHHLSYDVSRLTSQRISELFQRVTEKEKQAFFKAQMARQSQESYWFYDTTSISSYSQKLRQVKFGYNKEDDLLAQLNLALLFGSESRLPVLYRPLSGNIPDAKTLPWLMSLFDELTDRPIQLVLDRGFYKAENVLLMCQEGITFIQGTKVSLKYVKEALSQLAPTMERHEHYDISTQLYHQQLPINQVFKASETAGYPVTLYAYLNSERATEERVRFHKQLQLWERELQTNQLIEKNQKSYKMYFTVKKEKGKVISVRVKDEAVSEKLAYAGYFVLLSNSRMSSAQVLSHYRDKDQVEKAFMNLKDRLNMRRLRVSSERGLEGKIFVQYLALILVSELKHRMEKADLFKDYTLDEVLEDLNRIECFLHPSFGMTVGEILQKQETLFKLLSIKIPPH